MATIGKALIIGGNGFIGFNLTQRLKKEGWYVAVIDLHKGLYEETVADAEHIRDIRKTTADWNEFDRIYQLGAQMGGAGYVFTGENDADILSDSLSINIHVLQELEKANYKGKVFYSSSVCCYPDEVRGVESDAYPANPPSNYGWEKLTSERLFLAYAKNYNLSVRIARFHNCFGANGTYKGGREKSPAAICRKVVEGTKEIEIWGDGKQLRPFIYVEDLLDGIEALMSSDFTGPVNLGPSEGITIDEMVDKVLLIAGKKLKKKHVIGPTGGQTRLANNDLAKEKLNWSPKRDLNEGLAKTYTWIKKQIYDDK